MRLKSLTLKGFKSFPRPTKLHFPSGICAIVGPNGCGKSNVVDAIRWVLGEQSAKMLRARAMTDLIFSGSNGAGPGVAEVRLVIKNNGQFFPPELSNEPEIEILRRVNRNGEGEYRLNGKPCRLKDIHYLFMDTGAGTRAYSIIDQGQVGTFVEMDAKERRHLIEEVAGISRYKSRKIEAKNKIIKTQENLDRTEDLLSELKSQLRKLSRQASQARRFLNLREEEDELKGSLFAWSWKQNLRRKKELETSLASYEEKLALIHAKIDRLDLDAHQITLNLTSLDDELVALKKVIQERQARLEEFLSRKARYDASIQRDKSKLESALKILDESQKGQDALRDTKGRLESEISSLEKELLQHRQKEKLLKKGLDEAKDAREKVRKALEEVKSELVDLAARHAKANSALQNSEDKIFELESRLERKKEALNRIETDLEAKKLERKQLTQKIETILKDIEGLEASKRAYEAEKATIEQALKEINKLIHAKELSKASLDARIKSLQEMEDQEAASLKQGAFKGINSIGIVADFIEVAPGFEHLVEAVLGELLKAPVLAPESLEEQIQRCLDAKAAGRFIVSGKKRKKERYAGTLAERVDVAPEVSSLIIAKLSEWRVVESLAVALKDFKEASGEEGIIAKSGEMVTGLGEIILPGANVKDPAKSMLVRRSELKRLHGERSDLSRSLAELRKELQGLNKKLHEQRDLFEQAASKLASLYASKATLERQIEKVSVEHEGLEERLSLIQFEIDEAESERSSLIDELEQLRERVRKEEALKKEIEAKLAGREEALRTQEAVFARRSESLKSHQIEIARLESDLENKKRELKRITKRIQGVAFKRERLQAEIEGLKSAIKEASIKQEDLLKKIEVQRSLVLEAQKNLDAKEEKISSLREKKEQIFHERRELERQMGRVQRELNQLVIQHEKVVQEMDFLKKAAREQLNIDLSMQFEEFLPQEFSKQEAEKRLEEVKKKLSRIGAVNLTAVEEHQEVEERYKFIEEQRQDLVDSIQSLKSAITKIDRTCKERFSEALERVNGKLKEVFPMLFAGGGAELALTDSSDPLESGVEYLVRLPGKRIKNLALLSGGEKAMAALALIFAIYLTKPSPFCFLDEVDAPLDEANTLRFNELIRQISSHSQVILITHNQRVMEAADTLYGVTMEEKGISKLVSVNLVE